KLGNEVPQAAEFPKEMVPAELRAAAWYLRGFHAGKVSGLIALDDVGRVLNTYWDMMSRGQIQRAQKLTEEWRKAAKAAAAPIKKALRSELHALRNAKEVKDEAAELEHILVPIVERLIDEKRSDLKSFGRAMVILTKRIYDDRFAGVLTALKQ